MVVSSPAMKFAMASTTMAATSIGPWMTMLGSSWGWSDIFVSSGSFTTEARRNVLRAFARDSLSPCLRGECFQHGALARRIDGGGHVEADPERVLVQLPRIARHAHGQSLDDLDPV